MTTATATATATPTAVTVLVDEPLHLHVPAAVRERITDPAFTRLLRRERSLEASKIALDAIPAAERDSRTWHRVFDAWRAVRIEIAAYRIETAALLASLLPALPERRVSPPEGVRLIGEAEVASPEWFKMRQGSLGGSDVGAVCKVGQYGESSYNRARAAHLDSDPQPQEHAGLALVGDIWEPLLVSLAASLIGRDVFTDKATYGTGTEHVNLDGFIPDADGRTEYVVEAKTSSFPAEWADAAPDGYVLQTVHNATLLGADIGLLVVNVNDERLKVYAVPVTAEVAAGSGSPKKLGKTFGYPAARQHALSLVGKWAEERISGASGSGSGRTAFKIDPVFVAQWRVAHERGIVFVDLETTSFSPTIGHVLEFGAVRDDGATLHRLYGVPADHLAWNGTGQVGVHGITPDMVAGLPVLIEDDEAVAEIAAFVGDRVVVAHNAPFEARFLADLGLSFSYADTMRAFGAVVTDPAVTGNTMADLVAWAGQEYRDGHRALADAAMLAAAFEVLAPLIWALLGDE